MVKKHTSKTAIRVTRNATGADGMSMRKPWKGYKRGGPVKKADGGPFEGQEMRAYQPTWRDKLARTMMGDAPPSPARKAFVEGLTGSSGLGQTGMGIIDATPAGVPLSVQENLQGGNYQGAALNAVPGAAASKAMFVGPFGALMLRNAEREAGRAATVHPVIGQELKDRTSHIRPELQDAVRGALTDTKDEASRAILAMRSTVGSGKDRDLFKGSGWSRGTEGAAKKEISDLGASLERVGRNEFVLNHPAGDFHAIYDIPPIKFDPSLKSGDGYFNEATKEIVLGGHPTKDNMKKSVGTALHEIQHAIQKTEGFANGSNPMRAARSKELNQEYFPIGEGTGKAYLPSWQQDLINLQEARGVNPENNSSAYNRGVFKTYQRSAGETEARNVADRRSKGYRYQVHPEDTEDFGRGLQIIDDSHMIKKASGGQLGNPPWYTRNEARGMSGMLKSPVPGRNDQIPLKVKGGSYVLPADIPSALGQGNTMAGGTILDKMFNKGPYGMNLPRARAGSSTRMTRKSSLSRTFADGGDVGESDIIAAGGEYILSPEQVYMIGGGDLDAGHKILDAFVKQVRSQHIKTLQKLPGPKKD